MSKFTLFLAVTAHLWQYTNADDAKSFALLLSNQNGSAVVTNSPLDMLINMNVNLNPEELKPLVKISTINGKLDMVFSVEPYRFYSSIFSFSSRTFCNDGVCSSPGPNIVVNPGDEITITVENRLAAESISSTASAALLQENSFRRPNNTKLEFFGLHADVSVSLSQSMGSVDADSLVTPGGSLTYTLKVRYDHPPGVHWYHGNAPGSAALQVMGGMIGAITVQPADTSVLPSWLDDLRVDSKLLVFTHIMLDAAEPTSPTNIQSLLEGLNANEVATNDYFSTAWSYTRLAAATGSKIPINAVYYEQNSSTLVSPAADNQPIFIRDAWFTNGQYQPAVSLTAQQWQILDMVAASGDRLLELEIRSPPPSGSPSIGIVADTSPGACEMQLLALDGVYLGVTRSVTHLPLVQGSRASIAVRCPSNGTYYLMSVSSLDPTDSFSHVGSAETKSLQVLAILAVTTTTTATASSSSSSNSSEAVSFPADLSMVPRFSFVDAAYANTSLSVAVEQAGCCGATGGQSLFWLGLGTDCTVPCTSTQTCALLYGQTYTVESLPSVIVGKCAYAAYSAVDDRSFTGVAPTRGMVQDITLWGSLEPPTLAPLTLQRQHFQIVSYDNSNMDTHYQGDSQAARAVDLSSLFGEPGDWRDTWPMLPGKTVLRAIIDNTDSMILRTTALKYADRGMQARVLVATQTDTTTTTSAVNTSTTSSSSAADTSTNATQSSSSILPQWFTSGNYCSPSGDSWSYSEEIDFTNRLRIITTSTACPNHFSVCQSSECGGTLATFARKLPSRIEIPLYPQFATRATDTTCWGTSAVGVALNGVGIYGPSAGSIDVDGNAVGTYVCATPAKYGLTTNGVRTSCNLNGEGDGTRYCGDAVAKYGRGFDMCGGRADLSLGVYKYHVLPVCLLKQLLAQEDIEGKSFQASITSEIGQYLSVSNSTTVGVSLPIVVTNSSSTNGSVTIDGNGAAGWSEEVVDLLAGNISSSSSSSNYSAFASSTSASGGRVSPQIGWAIDGFPIYGPYGPHGQLMQPCDTSGAHPIICLDECNGFKATLPGAATMNQLDWSKPQNKNIRVELAWGDGFSYRYYMTGPTATAECSSHVANAGGCLREDSKCCLSVLPPKRFFPYSIGCLRGCLANSASLSLSGVKGSCSYSSELGTSEAYAPSISRYPSSVYSPLSAADIARIISAKTNTTNTSSSSPTDVELNRQKNLTDFQRAFKESSRNVLVRFPNQSVSIISSVGSGFDPTSYSFTIEDMPTGANDSVITGLAVDQETDRVYFATEYGIFTAKDKSRKADQRESDPSVPQQLVAGLLTVTIIGFNLGTTVADVREITVRGAVCTSTVLSAISYPVFNTGSVPLTQITCITGSPIAAGPLTAASVSAADVRISVPGGDLWGSDVHPVVSQSALVAMKGGSGGRPTIVELQISTTPFRPHALALRSTRSAVSVSVEVEGEEVSAETAATAATTTTVDKYLYWSNEANGASGIYRCKLDGSRIETVALGIDRVFGLSVLTMSASQFKSATERASSSLMTYASLGRLGATSTSTSTSTTFDNNEDYIDVVFYTSFDELSANTVLNTSEINQQTYRGGSLSFLAATPISNSSTVVFNGGDDASQLTMNVPLLQGLSEPTSVFVDHDYDTTNNRNIDEGYLYLGLLDGTIYRITLSFVLAATQVLQVTENDQLTAIDLGSLLKPPFWIRRVLGGHQRSRSLAVFSIPSLYSLQSSSTTTSSAANSSSSNNSSSSYANSTTSSVSYNITTTATNNSTSSSSRTNSTSSSSSSYNISSTSTTTASRQQRRLWSLDTNNNLLRIATDTGSSLVELDVSSTGIWWPSAIASSIHRIYKYEYTTTYDSSSRQTKKTTSTLIGVTTVLRIYISEILGKTWRLDYEIDDKGAIDTSYVPSPTLVVDLSSSPMASKVRARLLAAKGKPPSERLFFELTSN